MAQGYLTLQEAAQHLHITLDELKMMAQKGKIRSFQDRGTLRFRIKDVEELARQRGISSDPDLVLGEASLPPKKSDSPRAPKSPGGGPRTPARSEAPEVFDFELDDSVELGAEPPASQKGSGKAKSPVPQAKEPAKSSAQIKSPSSAQIKSPSSAQIKKSPSGSQIKTPSGSQSKIPPLQVKSGTPPKSGTTPRSGGVSRDKAGSDSDVKLVSSSRDDVTVSVAPDSDIKLRERGSGTKTPSSVNLPARSGQPPTSDPTKKRRSKLGPTSPQPGPDSGVRLIPMDSDSDVKIVPGGGDEVPLGQSPSGTLADSNVRLDQAAFPPVPEETSAHLTEEINLDEELQKEEQRLQQQPKQPTKVKPKSQLKFPTTSPFELSDSDVDRPSAGPDAPPPAAPKSKAKGLSDSSDFDMTVKDDSSNFELKAATSDSSNFELQALQDSGDSLELAPSDESLPAVQDSDSSEDDLSLQLDDSDSALDGGGGEMTAPASGINLSNPTDAGISLEDQKASDDSLEFDLSLEPEATPKPPQMKSVESEEEGSSEFELSLELPDEKKSAEDSDSEFELTLDDSSGEVQADAASSDDATAAQDIFESDFEIPALQEEAGAAAEPGTVDTEVESSDFDLALDDSELASDEESGSQVVALDEEEVEVEGEEEAEVQVDDEEFGGLEAEGAEGEVEDEEDDRPARVEYRDKILKPAPWGALPAILMIPCVVVMLLTGLVGYEIVQSSVANRPPGFMTRALNDNVLVGLGVTKPLAK